MGEVPVYPDLHTYVFTYPGVGGYEAKVKIHATTEQQARKQFASVYRGRTPTKVEAEHGPHWMDRRVGS
jgi:hypothetical protein